MEPMESKSTDVAPMEQVKNRTMGLLQAYFQSRNHLRKGICLLNAGQYELATDELTRASTAGCNTKDLSSYLVKALLGSGRYQDAAAEFEKNIEHHPDDVDSIIRLALVQWKSGKPQSAIDTLRSAVTRYPNNAELHFQLGTLLAGLDENEEAELRFTQAIVIDRNHTEAQVSLAMCLGSRQDVVGAVRHLSTAQHNDPGNARIALLLSCAAKACQDLGEEVTVRADMPEDEYESNNDTVSELSRLIESEPEFAEAFLLVDDKELDRSAFALLSATLKMAIERNPHRENLYYLRGQALARLGQVHEAIEALEQATRINPKYIVAIIQLAKLYQQTNRFVEATARLEETTRLGAEYADTYYMLGNLYRDTGKLQKARRAYEHALSINSNYVKAQEALESLAA